MVTQGLDDRNPWTIFLIFLRLGLTSFGGPIAHLGFFRREFVTRRGWLSEHDYADLLALCQFLPGPASSQVGIALGLSRAGYAGALAAWAGFTLPSAVALVLFALAISRNDHFFSVGALHGLHVVAVAVVAQAVWGMSRSLCPDVFRAIVMALSACVVLLAPTVGGQVAVLLIAGTIGALRNTPTPVPSCDPLPIAITQRAALSWLALFFILLVGLPLVARWLPGQTIAIIDAFYRAGSLVFGGGHVVLPLLHAETVPTGWIANETFLSGYGAAQAVPGPLFTFASFLGASMRVEPTGGLGGIICLLAIYTPSFLLVFGTLPFWKRLGRNSRAQSALAVINAAVVGILLAALYHPVWTSAIMHPQDYWIALAALVALTFLKLPAWLVVIAGGAAGWVVSLFSFA